MGLDVRIVADQSVGRAPEATAQASGLQLLARAVRSNRKALTGVVLLGLFVLVAIFAPLLAPYDPHAQIFDQTLGPSLSHWLGTTGNGQDIFSQLIWSTRESLAIALAAGLMATILSLTVGVSAAYLG